MSIHFTAVVATGIIVPDQYVNERSCSLPIRALSQRSFSYPAGFTLFTHNKDVEKIIYDDRVAGSSVDLTAFRQSGMFPVEVTYALRGGAREPTVVVMDEKLPEQWPHHRHLTPELSSVLKTYGRYVRCFFTHYHYAS